MRRVLVCVAAALALGLAGCGKTTEVRETSLLAHGVSPPEQASGAPEPVRGGQSVRIAVVTHGQASSAFWAIVHNGIDAAARQMDVSVTYRSPDTYSVPRMRTLIDEAIDSRPDGLVVSIPSPDLAGSIRRAVNARIPVVSINSGSDISHRLGVLAHVGQLEDRAGFEAGQRLAAAGVRDALCLNHEVGNEALDQRCRAFARAIRRAGGRSHVLAIDVQKTTETRNRLSSALASGSVDGILSLNTGGAQAALAAVRRALARKVTLGTFDLSPDVLAAVRAGRMRFAVDQQAYLEGYLPIVMLAQRVRYGLFPETDVIPTGPSFVTRATAAQAIRLSQRGIR
jgi:simple sugar transport system substrate-binding protein